MSTQRTIGPTGSASTAAVLLMMRASELAADIDYRSEGDWDILIKLDGGVPYIQVRHRRRDIVTGAMGWGAGGKYRLSEHATDSEIVQAVFGLFKAYEEHEARENFYWRDARVFGPHIDVRALAEIAHRFDARSGPIVPEQTAEPKSGVTVRMLHRTPNHAKGQLGVLHDASPTGRTNQYVKWVDYGEPIQWSHGQSESTGEWCGPGEYEVVTAAEEVGGDDD